MLNVLSQRIHKANEKWWLDLRTGERLNRDKGELLCLIHSEISECMEGERKSLMDTHITHRPMAEVELADILIRTLDYAAGFGYDLDGAMAFKMGMPIYRYAEQIVSLETMIGDIGSFYLAYGESVNKGYLLTKMHSEVTGVFDSEFTYARNVGEIKDRLAGLIFCVCRYAHTFKYDLRGAVEDKLAYNAQREDHKAEARLAANGKKW